MRFLPLLLALVLPALSHGEEVRIAVASNFLRPLEALVERYEAGHDVSLQISAGSTGKLYTQILHGGPWDVFLAADEERPRRLEEDGRIVSGSCFTYAEGSIVLWSRTSELFDASTAKTYLQQGNRLAMANPKLAPYGRAAQEVLDALGVSSSPARRFIQGESISQTWQFVKTRNAEVGFVAMSQWISLKESERASYWIPDADLYSPIRQDAVQLRENPAATRFLAWLQDAEARAIIQSFGYQAEATEDAGS